MQNENTNAELRSNIPNLLPLRWDTQNLSLVDNKRKLMREYHPAGEYRSDDESLIFKIRRADGKLISPTKTKSTDPRSLGYALLQPLGLEPLPTLRVNAITYVNSITYGYATTAGDNREITARLRFIASNGHPFAIPCMLSQRLSDGMLVEPITIGWSTTAAPRCFADVAPENRVYLNWETPTLPIGKNLASMPILQSPTEIENWLRHGVISRSPKSKLVCGEISSPNSSHRVSGAYGIVAPSHTQKQFVSDEQQAYFYKVSNKTDRVRRLALRIRRFVISKNGNLLKKLETSRSSAERVFWFKRFATIAGIANATIAISLANAMLRGAPNSLVSELKHLLVIAAIGAIAGGIVPLSELAKLGTKKVSDTRFRRNPSLVEAARLAILGIWNWMKAKFSLFNIIISLICIIIIAARFILLPFGTLA